jgi:hypothetical protein
MANNLDSESETNSKKARSVNISNNKTRFLLIFIGLFAVIGLLALFRTDAAPKLSPAVTLSLSPASQRVQVGQSLSLAVKLNTNGNSVNAVQADLTYPASNFEFVSIDGANSVFTIEAEGVGGNGVVKIARGNINSINSADALVAVVNFRATAAGRKAKISFANTSAVIRTDDTANILQRLTGGTYTVQ